MVNDHHVQYQKKTNDPIFRKFSDRQMDQPRDNRQTSAKDNLQGWMYNLI